ncbi:MAG: DEAD/DEAH box helicase [Clostridia bacterium]
MKAVLKENKILVFDSYNYKEVLKSAGARWKAKDKAWELEENNENVELLQALKTNIQEQIIENYNKRLEIFKSAEDAKFEKILLKQRMPVKVTPFEHQKRGYDIACKLMDLYNKENLERIRSGAALLMEMGTGKTLTAIGIAGRAYKNKKIKKLLVIAPSSVVPVWPKELEDFADFEFTVVALQGTMQKRVQALHSLDKAKGLKVAVINYESAWRIIDEFQDWNPDMIILDESQRIKNPQAVQSKAIHKLGKQAYYKLILSGTPIQNSPLDFFSQYKFLNSTIFGENFYLFKNRYARFGGFQGHQVIAYNNLSELTKKAHSIAFRITKDEALDLPEQIYQNRYIELEPETRRMYDQIKKENFFALENGGEITTSIVLTRLLRLSQITGGFVKTDTNKEEFISKAKLNELEEIIEDVVITNNKKVVIFARFINEIAAIRKIIESKKIDYRWIAGEIKQEDRGQAVKEFQENEDIKIFIAQIQTAGLGITLTAADTAVFYSLDYNYANYQQATARTHRIGQKNKCTYIHLLCKKTVDEEIMKALDKKQDIAKLLVDNWREIFK